MLRDAVTRMGQLVLSCVGLGVGVGMVLSAQLGSDGYSSLIDGISRASELQYAVVNPAIGLTLVLLSGVRGVRPGVGTITHPVVVGLTVSVVLDLVATPGGLPARVGMLGVGVLVLSSGIVGYLDAELGAGPFEAASCALRPIPFRYAYIGMQALGALTGWALGAAVGMGTLAVVFGVGPVVHVLQVRLERARAARDQT